MFKNRLGFFLDKKIDFWTKVCKVYSDICIHHRSELLVSWSYFLNIFKTFFFHYRKTKMANINQLMRRQSSRELVHRQFSKDIDARLEMSMMGDFYHGRRIHYSGGSFKMRARSKSEVTIITTSTHRFFKKCFLF